MISSGLVGLASSLASLSKRTVIVSGDMMGSGEGMMDGGHGSSGFTATFDTGPPPTAVLPTWFFILCLCVAVVSFPVFLFMSYTLNQVIPVLAMIEDSAPPAFEPLATSDELDAEADNDAEADKAEFPGKPAMVTASIRRTTRLLRRQGGIRSYFRGFWCAVATGVAMSVVHRFFGAFVSNSFLYTALNRLLIVFITLPLTTAWTHIVMSAPRPNTSWYRRLPPLHKTFSAMWRPALVMWAVVTLSTGIPHAMVFALGVPDDYSEYDPNWLTLCWKLLVVMLVALCLTLALVMPAYVVFKRVQASLLPLKDEPIISFDRSFGGTIPPEIVSAQGYVTMADAWRTFPKDSWVRIIRLYMKLLGIGIAFFLVLIAVIVPAYIVASRHAIDTLAPVG